MLCGFTFHIPLKLIYGKSGVNFSSPDFLFFPAMNRLWLELPISLFGTGSSAFFGGILVRKMDVQKIFFSGCQFSLLLNMLFSVILSKGFCRELALV